MRWGLPAQSARIVLVPSSFYPKVGGLETAIRYLSLELARRGHEVSIVTNRYPRSLKAYESVNGIPVYRLLMTDVVPSAEQAGRLGKYLMGVAIAPIQLARLAKLIHGLKPHLVNAHYLGVTAPYAYAGSEVSALPFVVSVHGSDVMTVPFPSGHKRLSRRVVQRAKACTACSGDMSKYLFELMGPSRKCKITVTGNGVNPEEFDGVEAYAHTRPYLYAASHFTPKKGIEVLLRALAQLRDAGHDIDLILAGSGPSEEKYKLLAQELGLNSRVHFWGVATRREMAALMHGCSVFVMPSLWEGFGITNLEAMVCRKAVVASKTGGIPEVVQDQETGVLVPPGDSVALAAAIADLLENADKRAAMGQKGREIAVTRFTWSVVTDRYLQAYEMAMEG